MMSMFMLSLAFMSFFLPQNVEAANNYIYGDGKSSAYSIRLDSPHFSGDVYHVHFYKKTKHLYCMRLDNLQVCDKNKSDRDSVPNWLMEKCMENSKVQSHVKSYNPQVQSNSGVIKWLLVAGAGILVILATINIFTGPADDVGAWALFFAALA